GFRRQLLDRRLDRRRRVIVALPRLGPGEQRRHRTDRVSLGVEIALYLRPGQRHRDGGTLACPRRQRRNSRRHTIVAEIVEEDLSRTLFLRHVEQEALRIVIRHPLTNTLRECLGLFPTHLVSAAVEQRRHHVQPLAARGLAETLNANVGEALPHFLGGL